MNTFSNTKIAFRGATLKELKKRALLFKLLSSHILVVISGILSKVAIGLKIPLGWLVRPTVFSLFCGGESLNESKDVVSRLSKFNVKSVLDFAAENQESEEKIEEGVIEIIRTIKFAAQTRDVPFAVFKPTALSTSVTFNRAGGYLDESGNLFPDVLRFKERVRTLCQAAYDHNVPIMIDAEESHYQNLVDDVAFEMMNLFNKQRAIVYNTFQMYRHDRLELLKTAISKARLGGYFVGIKLVRGAYWEKEIKRAKIKGYPIPVYPEKHYTDHAFDSAQSLTLENLDITSLFSGTHNEKSMYHLMSEMHRYKVANNDIRVYSSQLYGMSDHISFNMADLGYNVAKYLPYGPVNMLLPYLLRRAEENRSISGETGRELSFINQEIARRNNPHN